MLVGLARATPVTAFQRTTSSQTDQRKNRPCTNNCRRRTGAFLPSALHEGADMPGRGRWGVTVTSGSGILLRFQTPI